MNGPMRRGAVALLALALTFAVGTGCGASADGQPGPAPVEVAVISVATASVPLTRDLPGRVESSRVAEVRARVAGIVLERVFQEGSDVQQGDVLFRIDPAPLRAAVQRADAAVARAKAMRDQTTSRAKRFENLVATSAVSQQEVEDAISARAQAEAELAAAEANQLTARLDLGYATVTAPISGRIGRAEVTEGALVGQGSATLLATIQQLDPVYVNMTQSVGEVQRLRRALSSGDLAGVDEGQAAVELLREDGAEYGVPGKLLFTDISVDAATGSVSLRAEFPNPEGDLLPGEFVRARLNQAIVQDGITVPQQALSRTAEGASVWVVEGGKAVRRPVEVGGSVGTSWLVQSGLNAGDQVIVEGLQRVRPGAPVTPVDWKSPTGTGAP